MKNGSRAELAIANDLGAGAGIPGGGRPAGGAGPTRVKSSTEARKRGTSLSGEKMKSLLRVRPGVESTNPGD